MRLQICILSLLLLAVLTVNADETLVVKITKVEDDTLTLDAGSNQGLKVGLKGRVYYEIIFGGEVKHIHIANISLIAVQSDESSAKVEKKTADIKPGHFAEIEGVQKAKGFLYVTSSPEGADISLDGEATGKKTPAQIRVSAGSHTVEARLKGYEPASQMVQVAANKVSRVEFQLTRGKGALTVLSEPLEVEVYLDGKLKGNTPLTIEDIPAGEYEVQVQMEGYYPWKRRVVVDNQESKVLEAQLEKHAVLVVEVSPKGSVSIDGGPEKPAPLRLPGIPLGKHTITTRAPDFEPQTVEVTLRAGEEKRVPVTLERSRGSIELRSSPGDATIYLDGEPQGQTPTMLELPTGEYTLELRKPLYRPATPTIRLKRGVNPPVTLSLKVQEGTLRIASTPENASIRINGELRAEVTLAELTLPPGKYTVTLEREDYEPHTEEVTLADRQVQRIEAALRMQPQLYVTRKSPKSRAKMVLCSLFLPGLGQYYGGRYVSGTLFLLTGLTFAAGGVAGDLVAGDLPSDEAVAVVGGVWVLSVLHALIAGPSKSSASPLAQVELPDWEIIPQTKRQATGVLVRYRF